MIEPNETALIVIDMQRGLFDRSTKIYREKELLDNINLLLDVFHCKGLPVYFVQHTNDNLMKVGSYEWSLHPDVEVVATDVRMNKHNSSAFTEKGFNHELAKESVVRLVVAGLVTDGCVKAACMDALRLGYEVILAADGHSSNNKDADKLIVEWNNKLAREGIEVIKTRDIVDELNCMNF